MRILNELETFTEAANELSVRMQIVVDDIKAEKKTREVAAKELDAMAREMKGITDTIKDLAYRFRLGEERVSTVPCRIIDCEEKPKSDDVCDTHLMDFDTPTFQKGTTL